MAGAPAALWACRGARVVRAFALACQPHHLGSVEQSAELGTLAPQHAPGCELPNPLSGYSKQTRRLARGHVVLRHARQSAADQAVLVVQNPGDRPANRCKL